MVEAKWWRPRRWTTLRKLVQYGALLAFIALFVASRRGGWPASLVNIPMRLDPLAMLAHLLASRTFLVGSTLALITVMLTLAPGRVWCGWLCPLGTTLDLFPLRRRRSKSEGPSDAWRQANADHSLSHPDPERMARAGSDRYRRGGGVV
jgi:polyferredoxin